MLNAPSLHHTHPLGPSSPMPWEEREGERVMGRGLGDRGERVLCAQALSCCTSPKWYVSTSPFSRRAGTSTPWRLQLVPYRTLVLAIGW